MAFAWKVWKALTFVGLVAQSNWFFIRQFESLSIKLHDKSSMMFSIHVSLLILILRIDEGEKGNVNVKANTFEISCETTYTPVMMLKLCAV